MKVSKSTFLSVGGAVVALAALVAMPARPEIVPSSSMVPPPVWPSKTLDETDPRQAHKLWNDQIERSESLPWGRDPFLPIHVPEISEPIQEPLRRAPSSRLTGISHRDGEYLAIIDRRILHVGDTLTSGYIIKNIDRTAVVIQRGDHEFTLHLGDQE